MQYSCLYKAKYAPIVLLDTTRSALQDTLVDTAQGFCLRFNTLGLWSPALPQHILPGEPIWVRFDGVPQRDCIVYEGVIKDTGSHSAKAEFHSFRGGEEFTLHKSTSEYITHPPFFAPHPEFYKTPSLGDPRLTRAPTFFLPTPEKSLPPPLTAEFSSPLLRKNSSTASPPRLTTSANMIW